MKRINAWLSQDRSSDSMERSNSVSHTQAAESLHEISVNTPTLRDQFAMSALQGILSSPVMGDSDLHESAENWLKDITESAYEFADAMLEARK